MSSLSTPTRLVDLVATQPGAVVSQSLLKSPGGNVTLFAFDAGEGLSEHTAPYDALLLLLDGHATVTVGGVEHEMTAGETLVLPANIPHALLARSPFKMLLTMLRAPGA